MMDIYIQSRGFSKDYRWLKVEHGSIIRKEPQIPLKAIELIDTNDYSVILGRFDGQLTLLVTGLKTKERTDNRQRPIRNSVAYLGDYSDEKFIKYLTVQALTYELAEIIDNAVKSGGDYGFYVTPEKLPKPQSNDGKLSPDENSKIKPFSKENKEEFADEIQELESLPGNEFLVVVTDIKTKHDLEKVEVWRGLTMRTDEDQQVIINTQTHKQREAITQQVKKFATAARNRFREILRSPAIIVLVISLSVNALLFQQWIVKQQGIKNLESRIEILQTQKIEVDKLREQERQQKEAALIELQQERKRYQDLLSRAQQP
jgi:hypothetical protein